MRVALILLTSAAALVAGFVLASSDVVLNRSQRVATPAKQIGTWTDASASITEYKATPDAAPRESDLIMFVGYSKNGAGETFAQFYDELNQTIFVLDRKSLDERVKNLKEQGISADQTERVVRDWPARRTVEF